MYLNDCLDLVGFECKNNSPTLLFNLDNVYPVGINNPTRFCHPQDPTGYYDLTCVHIMYIIFMGYMGIYILYFGFFCRGIFGGKYWFMGVTRITFSYFSTVKHGV